MQQPREKRRCSILKKRRSRSLSPKSPQREHAARRASRRISFSGKHNVREFFTNENAAIVWGETYDVSTEKHILSNEQITLQSTHSSSISSTLHTTRNESAAMDISNIIPTTQAHEDKKADQSNSRPPILQTNQTYTEDQKENIMVTNDTDMPSVPALPSEPLFKLPPTRSNVLTQSKKPSMFNFVRKPDTSKTMATTEKTNCSYTMDISGIEPTFSNETQPRQKQSSNQYRNWLKENNFIAKPKSETDYRRQTVNQVIDMQFDQTQTMTIVSPVAGTNNEAELLISRKAINESIEMSIDALSRSPIALQSSRRETVNHIQDMQLDTSELVDSPIIQQGNVLTNLSSKRDSIHVPSEMSIEKQNQSDMSIELIPSEMKCQSKNNRQTTHRVQDISLDTPTFGMNPRQFTDHKLKDMSLDMIQMNEMNGKSLFVQSGNLNCKIPLSNRITINEPKDMSFDSTTKTDTRTNNNRTILCDMSMELQYTQPCKQPSQSRKSVICKSPSKNCTNIFDQSGSFELTKGIEQNSMYLSYHPIHSTKLCDINSSEFTEIDFDSSGQIDRIDNNTIRSSSDIEETFIEEKKKEFQIHIQPKQVQIFNHTKETHEACDLDISENSPIPTAKKYNLNKTPFYFRNDPVLVNMLGSDSSSLDITNNSKEIEEKLDINRQPTSIDETNTQPIEISDTSIEYISEKPADTLTVETRRKTNFHETSMVLEPIEIKGVNNFMTQSILQITPMKIDDSFENKLPQRPEEYRRHTYISNEPIAIDDFSLGHKNQSNALEESKLTFIEDDDEDDDDDQICNTKLALATSLESYEVEDFVERKCASFATNKSYNLSKLSLQSEISLANIQTGKIYSVNETKEIHPTESIPKLSDTFKNDELNAFKKSNRLRHSNVFEANAFTDGKQSESSALDEISTKNISNKPVAIDERPLKQISMAPVHNSSKIQPRYSIGSNTSTNETSYLTKSSADKPLSEIKLNFSGYEKLIGLATIQDIVDNFCNRMDQINQKAKHQEEQRQKYVHAETAMVDQLNNMNDEELVSQNIEAPSWSFLFNNKIKWEDEQQKAELNRQWEERKEERLFSTYLPSIPDINILTLNKCRMLKNWTFDDIWFFNGNIHLRNNSMPAFKVCLIYDPNSADKCIETYGALKFGKINRQFCPIHMKERDFPVFRMEVQELKSKLPSNLLPLCETSSHLSDFDEKMNEYCVKAQTKVNEIQQLCRETQALIKEEKGLIYIIKTMLDFEGHNYQDYIIELSDIDSTEWRNVRTNPRRVLNEEIKTVPRGIPFIKELLTNDSKYVPWK